jgi:GDP-L-fucose synthase
MFKEKKILVAGGTGFIGVNLVNRMLDLGANVRATLHNRPAVIMNDAIEYVTCDFTNMDDCKKAVNDVDYVFMCAANTSGAAVMAATPLVHVTPNIVMNAQLLEASYLANVKKFIFISSSVVYPLTGDTPAKEDMMLLDDDPYETYFGAAWMKRYSEILCRLYSEKLKKTMPAIVVRPSNIYGPYDKFDPVTSHVMGATIRKVVERNDPIEVWGTGDDVRDLIYIDDFLDGLLLAVEKIDTYDPVNIASGFGYSIKEILEFALEIDDYIGARVTYDSSKPSMIPIRLFDTTKAENQLGFKAKTDIKAGSAKTIQFYKDKVAL